MTAKIFYQTIDLPGEPTHVGQWDHRATKDLFLGRTDFTNKTVLEIGPASGFWTFEIERRGGSVTCLELDETDEWDVVPHGGRVAPENVTRMRTVVDGIQAAFWHSHEKLRSRAKVKRGNIYNVAKIVQPAQIGLVGNVLQHLRNPFAGIEAVASMISERFIISEALWIDDPSFIASPRMQFIPRAGALEVIGSWYLVSPTLAAEWLKLLGFKRVWFELHEQRFIGTHLDKNSRMVKHYTCVADR